MHQIFNIYIAFPECPKIIQTFTQNSKTLVDFLSRRIWRCLKRAFISSVMTHFNRWWLYLLGAPRIEGHPCMLGHCYTRILASISVASTKVALSLQGRSLAKSKRKVSSGCIMSGNVLVLCKARYNQIGHGRHFQEPYCIGCTSLCPSYPCAFFWQAYSLLKNNCFDDKYQR